MKFPFLLKNVIINGLMRAAPQPPSPVGKLRSAKVADKGDTKGVTLRLEQSNFEKLYLL